MGYEAVVQVSVKAFQHVGGVAAVGSTHAGELAYVVLALEPASGCEIVLHVEARVVAGNLLLPLLSEGSGAAAVRHDDHIALLSHEPVAPAVAPVLGIGSLRTSEHDFYSRILLGRVEVRRVEHPALHLFAVHGLKPYAF